MSATRHAAHPPSTDAGPDPALRAASDPAGTVLSSVSRHFEGRLTVVRVHGEVDHDTAGPLRTMLIVAVDGSERVCCDLSGVEFLGAAGLNAMVAAQRRAASVGCRFHVRGARGITLRVLEMTGLDRILGG